jgi:hypothetical protein
MTLEDQMGKKKLKHHLKRKGSQVIYYRCNSLILAALNYDELFRAGLSLQQENKILKKKIRDMNMEKDDMIDNFKLSTGVLLERLKDLEAS